MEQNQNAVLQSRIKLSNDHSLKADHNCFIDAYCIKTPQMEHNADRKLNKIHLLLTGYTRLWKLAIKNSS